MSPGLRVAVLGANGQVGAELCLLLTRQTDWHIVPVCRTRSGSAFLRWMGLACRHGDCSDLRDASRLLGDCDVVVNSALARGTPARIRRTEDQIVHHAFACSRPGAVIVHFSTQTVYGDPRRGGVIRWKSPYGRAKLVTERRVLKWQRRLNKPAFVFRLGHVCGALQNISMQIRDSIERGVVHLPAQESLSNTVYTVVIAEAIAQAVAGSIVPSVYDLMNVPQWTWTEVYDYESRNIHAPLRAQRATGALPARSHDWAQKLLASAARGAISRPFVHRFGSRIMAHLPNLLNQKAEAWWNLRRARAEIAELTKWPAIPEHLTHVANGSHFIQSLTATSELLAAEPYRRILTPVGPSWPDDQPGASAGPAQIS